MISKYLPITSWMKNKPDMSAGKNQRRSLAINGVVHRPLPTKRLRLFGSGRKILKEIGWMCGILNSEPLPELKLGYWLLSEM